jgi:hypothetical protein
MLGFLQMTEKRKEPEPPIGRPLALDPLAASGWQTEPAFIARPAGAPVYHGTDFEIETCDEGDAFMVWEVSDKSYFQEML